MFGLFKKIQNETMSPSKSTKEIIKEIHDTFDTEVDRLLEEARIEKSTETNLVKELSKSKRLKSLGFTSTKTNQIADKENTRLKEVETENKNKKELIEAINYFSFNYPQYKFITIDSVKKICEKYGLIYGDVDRYISDVPDKNLEIMENFSIKEEDVLYKYEDRSFMGSFSKLGSQLQLKAEYSYNLPLDYPTNEYKSWKLNRDRTGRIGKCKLQIAAPPSDFDLKDHEIKDFKISKIEIPDPIVLQPVVYKEKPYYLVVTAWGLEGNDELVVNQKMN